MQDKGKELSKAETTREFTLKLVYERIALIIAPKGFYPWKNLSNKWRTGYILT